jgi:hypothetical protein
MRAAACSTAGCVLSSVTCSVRSHDSASRSGEDVEGDGVVEDEVAGADVVGEADVLEVDEADLVGGDGLAVSALLVVGQRGGGGEGELAGQRHLLLIVLLAPQLLLVLLLAQHSGRIHVHVLHSRGDETAQPR